MFFDCRGRLEADEGGGRRHAAHPASAQRRRHERQVGELVLPLDEAPQVDAPGLGTAGAIAERLEGDRHLDRPAVLEPGGLHVPDPIPRLVLLIVGDGHVAQRAEGVGLEQVTVAAIVQRVDHERDVLVAEDVAVVAAQLVRHLAIGLTVPAPCRHIQIGVIEQDPRLGLLGGHLPLARFLLNEVGERRDGAVDGLLETAIQCEGSVEPHRPHGHIVGRGAADQRRHRHLRHRLRGGAVDGEDECDEDLDGSRPVNRGGAHGRPYDT